MHWFTTRQSFYWYSNTNTAPYSGKTDIISTPLVWKSLFRQGRDQTFIEAIYWSANLCHVNLLPFQMTTFQMEMRSWSSPYGLWSGLVLNVTGGRHDKVIMTTFALLGFDSTAQWLPSNNQHIPLIGFGCRHSIQWRHLGRVERGSLHEGRISQAGVPRWRCNHGVH